MTRPGPVVTTFSPTRTLAFATTIVVGFFALAEGTLRVVGVRKYARPRLLLRAIDTDISFPFMRADPDLFWSPRPGYRGEFMGKPVTINELGLRGGTVAVARRTGRRRLACFGDSITFGYGAADDETYCFRLGSLLAGRGVETVNAGVTGYTSHQVLGLVRRISPQLGLDLATICIGWNDSNRRPVTDEEYARRLRLLMRVEGPLDRLYLYRALKGLYLRAQERLPEQGEATSRVPLPAYVRNLEAIVAECRARGIQPVFIALPHRRRADERPQSPYAHAVRDTGRRLAVPVLSAGILGLEAEAVNEQFFIDSLHLSASGHTEMARLLAEQLAALGLV